MAMTTEQLREYATWLIEDHAQDVEWLSVFESWETFSEDGTAIDEDDARKVHDLVTRKAEVAVSWPEPEDD